MWKAGSRQHLSVLRGSYHVFSLPRLKKLVSLSFLPHAQSLRTLLGPSPAGDAGPQEETPVPWLFSWDPCL